MSTRDLEGRIEALERSGRQWRWAACIAGAGLFAMIAIGQSGTTTDAADEPQRDTGRKPLSLSVVVDRDNRERLYRMWSDGTIERTQAPIFDFRGNDKWDLLRRP